MTVLTSGMSWIDLEFQGRPQAIAAAVLQAAGGVAIVDPGPSTCLGALERGLERRGIGLRDVTHLLLTHIHLDHAGAAGTIVRAHPHVLVMVHERGAPHMAHPGRLLESAARLYGERMQELWGEFAPVPPANLVALRGGERVVAGGRTFDVAYTPGHASHHVSYFEASSGVAFVGDTAGVTIGGGYVLPPTPPPDIDLDRWRESVGRIRDWSPGTLFLTHFGPVMSVDPHLQTLLEHLDLLARWVRALLDEPGTDEQRCAQFLDQLRHELRRHMTEAQMASYPIAAPFEQLWLGLARYWRKR